jgi:hypothetical protein
MNPSVLGLNRGAPQGSQGAAPTMSA